MSGTVGFLAALGGALAVVCLGIALVISAFVRGKPTKAGVIRACIGGALLLGLAAAVIVLRL